MSSIVRPLSHMPYFEQLAELPNDSAEWRSASAALVMLRLFDSWMREGAEVVSKEAPGLQAATRSLPWMCATRIVASS